MKINLTNEEAQALSILIDAGVEALKARALLLPSGPQLIAKLALAAQAEIVKQQKAAKKLEDKSDGNAS